MTDPVVGIRPALIAERDIKSGVAVRENTWAGAAGLANHLNGRGRCLIPATRLMAGSPGSGNFAAATEYVFRFRVSTSIQAVQREWVFQFDDYASGGSTTLGAAATYTIEVPNGGTSYTHVAPAGAVSQLRIVELLGAQSAGDTEITCSISASAVHNSLVVSGSTFTGANISVTVYETARPSLKMDATDLGANVGEVRVGSPIKAETLTLLTANAAQTTILKRGGYAHWSVPATAGGVTTTSFARSSTTSTYAPIWCVLPETGPPATATGIPILVPKYYRTSTTGTVQVRVLGWVSAASTLSVRATTSRSGTTTSAVTTTSTSPTWLTAIATTVDCEDLATDNGLRGPDTLDMINVEFARTAGAGTVYVAAISIFD